MPANNDYIDLSDEDKKKIENGGVITKEYEKKSQKLLMLLKQYKKLYTIQLNLEIHYGI